jgi:hypothetical protein
VAALETRVRAPVRLRLDTFEDPITGLAISIPDGRQPELNRLFLRAGQLPDPDRGEQVLISEARRSADRDLALHIDPARSTLTRHPAWPGLFANLANRKIGPVCRSRPNPSK